MSKTVSLFCALLCTFIWGTTFIAQDTGMDDIGPFTFNAVRFFVGFLAIIPLMFWFEAKKIKSEFNLDKKTFIFLSFLNWFITFFRISSSTSRSPLYRCCKALFYNFLCSYGSNNNFFF